ncbi:hypothetical protein [Paenibacillus chibensis]|nr:hypothetical protein [Paenibacillus chibensis]
MLLLISLSACRSGKTEFETKVDWVDFIMLDQTMYTHLPHRGIVADPSQVATETPIGFTAFEISGNIHHAGYQPKDGDAAFLPAGTAIYGLNDPSEPAVIAVKDPAEVNGFKLYTAEHSDFQPTAEELDLSKVIRIDIYQTNPSPKRLHVLTGAEMKDFIRLLEKGQDSMDQPDSSAVLTYYDVIFYGMKPYAFSRALADDGRDFIFYGKNVQKVSPEIKKYVE